MYTRIGNAAFVALGVMILSNILFSVNGYYIGKVREKVAEQADKRIKILEETINSILVIKMYCWESFSLKKIIETRKRFYNLFAKVIWKHNLETR